MGTIKYMKLKRYALDRLLYDYLPRKEIKTLKCFDIKLIDKGLTEYINTYKYLSFKYVLFLLHGLSAVAIYLSWLLTKIDEYLLMKKSSVELVL